ncbi:uncharacterized protein LOC116341836 [Contarinia nasturtii]|uniref:uncharacterized protein LOC116341836 n=1 Tax=Contarinia nasturtii TaxID=265458 RepID=UPI0012D4755B|nr:uncharacterized protein LOC116341836 [Contarinia nasturtii]
MLNRTFFAILLMGLMVSEFLAVDINGEPNPSEKKSGSTSVKDRINAIEECINAVPENPLEYKGRRAPSYLVSDLFGFKTNKKFFEELERNPSSSKKNAKPSSK